MISYFIVYTFKTKYGGFGDGNTDITLDEPISSINHVREIEKALKNHHDLESCVVHSFIKFDDATVSPKPL